MSTTLRNTTSLGDRTDASAHRSAPLARWPWWVGGAGAVALLAAMAWFGLSGDGAAKAAADPAKLATVERRDLVVTVDQPGQIEARSKKIIRSEVRQTVEINKLIDEGTVVEPNQVLVQLDKTKLLEQQDAAEQKLDSARSSKVAAEVNLDNTDSQSKSNIAQSELDVEFAELALRKYVEGEYPQKLRQAQANVQIARETSQRAADKAAWSKRLEDKGYITDSEAKADAAAARKAELDLEIAQGELDLLQQYSFHQTKRQLTSDLEQAKAELERVQNKAKADIEKAKVELNTARANLRRAEKDYEQALADIDHATIRAPTAGRVVYAPQGRRWRQEEPLAQGDELRHNQEIIHLPASGAMSVAIKIDESQRDKAAVGMPVVITGPNLPDGGLRGKLVRIAEYLDPSGWWNNNMKVYSATVNILNERVDLRTGMNCQTQIIVARHNDVLVVPLQSVVMVDGRHVAYLPGHAEPRPVPVQIGLDDGSFVHIKQGLDAGQKVLLAPPLSPSARDHAAELDMDDEDEQADGPWPEDPPRSPNQPDRQDPPRKQTQRAKDEPHNSDRRRDGEGDGRQRGNDKRPSSGKGRADGRGADAS